MAGFGTRFWVFVFAASLAIFAHPVAAQVDPALKPYETLRRAYGQRSGVLAASAYAADARFNIENETPPVRVQGKARIGEWFQAMFDGMPAEHPLDLNFRIDGVKRTSAGVEETGVYRMIAGRMGTAFGRFKVVRDDARGVFLSDTSLPGTREDFEKAAGPVMFDQDAEDLDPKFYGRLSGRYTLPNGCQLSVTHSVVQVLVRDLCTQSWRGLARQSGLDYLMGVGPAPDAPRTKVVFDLPANGAASAMTITENGAVQRAVRKDPYTLSDVTFPSGDGTKLAGSLWRPAGKPKAVTVLLHGSGPQDRNGYASIIAIMADELAASGHAVLTFDKRGSGRSGGNGNTASFAELGTDARAALAYVKGLPEFAKLPAGFSGSSQAGWVAAAAIRDGATADHVILLGAAGAGATVEEQNLYNTETQMRCAGISRASIDLALAQQRAFFDFLSGRGSAAALDAATARASAAAGLGDWLFPGSAQAWSDASAWYNVLELKFDPATVWTRYRGRATFILGSNDNSTPSPLIAKRWADWNQGRAVPARVAVLDGADHLGLISEGPCDTSMRKARRFHPDLFGTLTGAASR